MLRLALISVLALLLATPAMTKAGADDKSARDGRATFSSAERNQIRAWLLEVQRREATSQPPTGGLPAGVQKKAAGGQSLPPGWEKKLVCGETLDHDYYDRGRQLPDELLRRLPPPPPGSEILLIGDIVVRLEASTRIVLDVFTLRGGN